MEQEAIRLLKEIISIPSYSFQEREVADFLQNYAEQKRRGAAADFQITRVANNLLLYSDCGKKVAKTLMLAAHTDTVKECESYTINPFAGEEKEGRIYGLGSNDDGGCVVCAIAAFLDYVESCKEKNINLLLVLGAEEERSGSNGMSLVVQELEKRGIKPDFAIIGEPTGLKAAVAERGLLVIDGVAEGVSGHAAREEGVNALYIAIEDIERLRNFDFKKISPVMGRVKLSVTQINCGTAHNVIPDKCTFTVDIRPTEQYSNGELLELLQKEVKSRLKARNLTNRSSATPEGSLLLDIIEKCGIEKFVSPTTSDWMRVPYPAIKIGPGESARSHKADEYITRDEISGGIKRYKELIELINNGNTLE